MAEESDITIDKEEKTEEEKQQPDREASDTTTTDDKTVSTTNEVDPVLEKQIIRQIEYYFGDINLPRDRFLQEQIKIDDGWIDLSVMLKFKRLSQLSTDVKVIAAALEKSSLMEVNEDCSKIRRSPNHPLPVWNDDRRKELVTRTIYVKGFPVSDTTLDKLLDYFAQHGPVENVQMRSRRDKATNSFIFKGSVFVTFPTKEKAEEFLNKDVKYEENDLIKKWQSVYIEDKRKEREELKLQRKGGAEKEGAEEKKGLPKGAILHVKGFSGEITREKLKEKIEEYDADIAYISFNKGDDEAWVRLQGENSTKEVLEKIKEKKLEVCGVELEVRALEGEEEEEFLQKTKDDIQKKRFHNNRNKRGGRRGGGRGGFRGGDRKRKGGPIEGAPPSKVSAQAE